MIRIWLSKTKSQLFGVDKYLEGYVEQMFISTRDDFKTENCLAIKSGLTLFGLGLGAGYFNSRQRKPSDNDTSIGISNPKQSVPAIEKAQNLSNRYLLCTCL